MNLLPRFTDRFVAACIRLAVVVVCAMPFSISSAGAFAIFWPSISIVNPSWSRLIFSDFIAKLVWKITGKLQLKTYIHRYRDKRTSIEYPESRYKSFLYLSILAWPSIFLQLCSCVCCGRRPAHRNRMICPCRNWKWWRTIFDGYSRWFLLLCIRWILFRCRKMGNGKERILKVRISPRLFPKNTWISMNSDNRRWVVFSVFFLRLDTVAPVILRPSNLAKLLASSRRTIEPSFSVVKERNATLLDFVVFVERVELAVCLFSVALAQLKGKYFSLSHLKEKSFNQCFVRKWRLESSIWIIWLAKLVDGD